MNCMLLVSLANICYCRLKWTLYEMWSSPSPAEPGYTLQIQISWLLKKSTDLDLHCLPLSMWIYINNLDSVIWLADWIWNGLLIYSARQGWIIPKMIISLWKHAYSNTLKILSPKNGNFSDKKFWYFSYLCSKHRLWVLIRTASLKQF